MDRRSFSKLALGACSAPLTLLSACGSDGQQDSPPMAQGLRSASLGANGSAKVLKYRAQPNPKGLRVGFWEVFTQQAATLASMGRRPSSRVSFDRWDALETAAGVYQYPNPARYGDTHAYGETILGSVNISFAVPPHYPNDITDPTTREAAKRFLRGYVIWMLNNFGAAVLTIDYEIVSNGELGKPGSEEKAQIWSAWYLEAAAVARQTAEELGQSALLTLQPIFNGNPFKDGNPIGRGGAANPWLRDVVEASDALALDTYFCDPTLPVTDASATIKIIEFWIEQYAGDKPVVVTENGFTTINEHDDSVSREQGDVKYSGTEAEQAAYYADLFPKLLAANQVDGVFRNQLRGFHIWSITDNPQADTVYKRYFGLYDRYGRAKPAAAIVKQAIQEIEADPFHQPYRSEAIDGKDLAEKLSKGKGLVGLDFREGDQFEFLRYTDTGPDDAAAVNLHVELDAPGTLLACVNGHWLIERDNTVFNPNISEHYKLGASNIIDLCFTATVFPVHQNVKSLRIEYATP